MASRLQGDWKGLTWLDSPFYKANNGGFKVNCGASDICNGTCKADCHDTPSTQDLPALFMRQPSTMIPPESTGQTMAALAFLAGGSVSRAYAMAEVWPPQAQNCRGLLSRELAKSHAAHPSPPAGAGGARWGLKRL